MAKKYMLLSVSAGTYLAMKHNKFNLKISPTILAIPKSTGGTEF